MALSAMTSSSYGPCCETAANGIRGERNRSEGGQRRRRAAALATLHKRSLAWRESPRVAVLGGLWPRGLATQQRPGSRLGDVKGPSPRPLRHGGILHGSTS